MIEMCDGFESACTADSRQHRFGHAFGNAPSYLDMGKIQSTWKIDSTEYEFLDIPWGMADHIAMRKSTFTSAYSSRKRRTHQPSVRDFGRRVSVNTKPEKYELMAKQKQAEECVLYVRVSTIRQAEDGVSIDAQIAKGKANAEFNDFLLPEENIFIVDGVSAKIPLWSRPAAKQMKAFILKHKIKQIYAYRMD